MAATSLRNFISSFTRDIARNNRFDVIILPPAGFPLMLLYNRNLSLRCEAAQLPGRTFDTVEQKTYGPIEKFVNITTYTDLDLTFIVDDDMSQKQLFDSWLELINPSQTNNVAYKSDYCCDMIINQYDVSNRLSYSVRVINAFPMSVNQMDLDWSSDGYHKLVVTFAYTRWEQNQSLIF
jgi:hypothetical protein